MNNEPEKTSLIECVIEYVVIGIGVAFVAALFYAFILITKDSDSLVPWILLS